MRASYTTSLPEEDVDAPAKPSLDAIEDIIDGESITLDKETNKRIVRKIDRKLMPVVRAFVSKPPSPFPRYLAPSSLPNLGITAVHHIYYAIL